MALLMKVSYSVVIALETRPSWVSSLTGRRRGAEVEGSTFKVLVVGAVLGGSKASCKLSIHYREDGGNGSMVPIALNYRIPHVDMRTVAAILGFAI